MFPAPKKSLGQNFLNSPKALADIISASELKAGEMVLEIGPGRGALTARLLETGAKVVAVEKDETLAKYLSELFENEISSGQFELVVGDILEIGKQVFEALSRMAQGSNAEHLTLGGLGSVEGDHLHYKLIANIPYYITGQIFRMFLEGKKNVEDCLLHKQPTLMTLLVQKEVAERVVARDKKESILSMSVKAYGTPIYVSKVLAGSFVPAPNVDSAILCIKNISKKYFVDNNIPEEKFFAVMKAGFAHKRKMLVGNLREAGFVVPESYKDNKVRAEDLVLEDWVEVVVANSIGE